MASGSFSLSVQNNIKLILNVNEQSWSTATNQSVVKCSIQVYLPNSYYSWSAYNVTVSGTGLGSTNLGYKSFSGAGTWTLKEWTYTANHNTDGSGSTTCSFSMTSGYGSASGSVTCGLTKIPRYFTSTPKLTLTSYTETTATYSWSTSEQCSELTWNGEGTMSGFSAGTSGTITISGLNPNTNYSSSGTFKRSDSGMTTKSNECAMTTYAYPYANSFDNFTIGNALSVGVYNPLKRSVTVHIVCNGTQIGQYISTSGTSVSGWADSTSIEQLLATCPNTATPTFYIFVKYGRLGSNSNFTKTAYVPNTFAPVISDYKPYENNEKIRSFLGNDRPYIYFNSISQTNMDVWCNGQNGASISKVQFTLGGDTKVATSYESYDTSKWVCGCITNATNGTWKIVVTDTRGLTTTINSTDSTKFTWVEYKIPTISVTASRDSQTSSTGSVTVKGTYYNYTYNGNSNTPTITLTRNETTQSFTSSISSGNFTCTQTYSDLDIESSFAFKATVTDSFGSYRDSTFNLSIATPTLWLGKDEVRINKRLHLEHAGWSAQPGYVPVLHDNDCGMEIGSMLDFHNGYADQSDFSYRLYTSGDQLYGWTNYSTGSNISGPIYNWQQLMDKIYPVGSIYMSVNSTSPATFFGGTWEQLTDRFLIGAGSSYSAGSTGGEATHTLSWEEMPYHFHWNPMFKTSKEASGYGVSKAGGFVDRMVVAPSDTSKTFSDLQTSSAGLSQAHNNMPPYLAVYMWKRTA